MSGFDLPKGVFRLTDPPPPKAGSFPFGLGQEGMHEVCEASYGDAAAVMAFALAATHFRPGPAILISQHKARQEHGRLLEMGLGSLRQDSPPFLHVETRRLADTLWALEEAVTSCVGSAVFGELEGLDFTASRRLRLAAVRHEVPLILLMPYTRQGSTAACARWRVACQLSADNPYDPSAPGSPRWHISLEKCRLSPQHVGTNFDAQLHDETLSLSVVPRLVPHASAPGKVPESAPGEGECIPFGQAVRSR